jgi:hypothetical protein
VSPCEQRVGDVGADEARSARHQDRLGHAFPS